MTADMKGFLALLLGLYALLFAGFVLVFPAPGVTGAWDFGLMAGFAAFFFFLMLFAFNGRPARWPLYDGKFFMTLHRILGIGAAVALTLHVAAAFVATPFMLRYVLPSAPGYMLAGVLAALLALLVVVTGFRPLRQRLFRSPQNFRHVHFGASALILGFSAWHVIGTGFHVRGRVGSALCIVLVSLAIVQIPAMRFWQRRRLHAPSHAQPHSSAHLTGHSVLHAVLRRRRNMSGFAVSVLAVLFVLSFAGAVAYAALMPQGGAG